MLKKAFISILVMFLYCSCGIKSGKAPMGTPYFDSVINVAEHLYDSGDKSNAITLVRTAYATNKDLSTADEINYLIYCNIFYVRGHDYESSLNVTDSLITYLEEKQLTQNMAATYIKAYNSKADALLALGLYNDAYESYYTAQKLARDNADSCSLSSYSYSMGMALYRQQRFGEAAYHFKQAAATTDFCKDDFGNFYFKQEVLDNIGLCYSNAKQYDSAMLFFDKAVKYIDENYNRFAHKQSSLYRTAEAVVYGNMASVFTATGKYDTAVAMYRNSIRINLQKGYTNSDALADQVKLADLYLARNDIPEMKNVLVDIKAELDSIPDKQSAISWNKLMWEYYDHAKDSVTAYRYLAAYMAMSDSFLNKNKSMMELDVNARMKNVGRQYQIGLLNRDNEKKKIYLAVTAVVLLMAIVIIILILFNARRSRHNVEVLTDLNNKVNDQKKKLEKALADLEFRDKDKSRILRSVAHDVMNPISAIVALSDILLYDSDNYTEEQKEIINLIKEACTNSLSLSRDILEAAVEIDTANMQKEWINVNKLVANSVELLGIRAHTKGQHIEVISSRPAIEAYVNKDKIWRVVNNLITNAIKFSYLNTTIYVGMSITSNKVCISVKDSGIGVPDKNKSNIFDMFTESKLPGTSGEVPHGMGLSISLQIAKAHGGTIWVESEEGKGATFHLEFPANNGI